LADRQAGRRIDDLQHRTIPGLTPRSADQTRLNEKRRIAQICHAAHQNSA
jgi:hypothetical protein